MWYPPLPVLLQLHERICAAQGTPTNVGEMFAIHEAILAPQRTSEEKRTDEIVAQKCALLIAPLIQREPFQYCGDRVAYSIAQRFADRNGVVLRLSIKEAFPAFEAFRAGEITVDELGALLESSTSSRYTLLVEQRQVQGKVESALQSTVGEGGVIVKYLAVDMSVQSDEVKRKLLNQSLASYSEGPVHLYGSLPGLPVVVEEKAAQVIRADLPGTSKSLRLYGIGLKTLQKLLQR